MDSVILVTVFYYYNSFFISNPGMPFTLYNTLDRQKQVFEPQDNKKVKIYSCGPTVYDYVHIGNWSSYLWEDLLVRALEKIGGWPVQWVINITDVGHLTEDDVGMGDTGEDKLEKGARREGKTPQEIADFYIQDFLDCWSKLRLRDPDARPRATDYVPQIIKFVENLVKRGVAYETTDGVYFEIEKFPEYGALSGNKLEQLQAGARVKVDEKKKSPFDFALWQKAVGKHTQDVQVWDSPWGRGFPGWHVECSVMSEEFFGQKKDQSIMDIHTGAEDNIFPHHECEIAQTGARYPETQIETDGCALSRFWLHRRHLLVDGVKMSKSKGNFYIPKDLKEKGFDLLDFRYLILSVHYRTPMNFTWKALTGAQTARHKIIDFWRRLQKFEPWQKNDPTDDFPQFYTQDFVEALADDLNTPRALAAFHNMMREANVLIEKEMMTFAQKTHLTTFLGLFDAIWDIFPEITESIPQEVIQLARERQLIRQDEDWERSDELRNEIEKMGWEIRDVKREFELRKKK